MESCYNSQKRPTKTHPLAPIIVVPNPNQPSVGKRGPPPRRGLPELTAEPFTPPPPLIAALERIAMLEAENKVMA